MIIHAERVRGDYCEDRRQAGSRYRSVAQALERCDGCPQESDERPTLPWDQRLGCQSYASPFWGTYKQMTEPDCEVRNV
jgi:hypothetical protein